MKTYKKVVVIAQNEPEGSYAAGCPANKVAKTRCSKPCQHNT